MCTRVRGVRVTSVCVCACVRACACVLTVDLQHLGGLLRGVGERHVVHLAGVRHTVVIAVHLQLQRAAHREGSPAGVHLLGP